MQIINTNSLTEQSIKRLDSDEASFIYNGLDVCVTAEIYNVLIAQLESDLPEVQQTYHNALAKMAPILEMSMRGTHIDEEARQSTINVLKKDLEKLDDKFQRIMREVLGEPLNWRSPTQLKNLFYRFLGIKEIKKRNQKGQYVATVNREALERFQVYLHAKPLARFVLILRDLHKQLSFLKTEIDKDQRIRTTYNIAGTNTGRLASSMSEFGTGTNLQNVNRKLRYPFTADPGMYMLNIDLGQADGRNVGATCYNLFYDSHGPEFAGTYLDACESGDLHTTVCRMTWPELSWPVESGEWKDFCDSLIAHGQDSYRQLAKKLGHGTNYYGTPRTMAKHTHVPTKVIEEFQSRYFKQFQCIPLWHKWVIEQIKEHGTITTLFGRRRMFFGRGNDASTWRKAIAYGPQSMTGEQIDRGLLYVWRKFPQVQLLNQVHDSILLQIPYNETVDLVPEILKTMQVVLELKGGRKFVVPLDAQGGWNWGKASKDNIYGLVDWTGKEERDRPTPQKRIRDYFKNAK